MNPVTPIIPKRRKFRRTTTALPLFTALSVNLFVLLTVTALPAHAQDATPQAAPGLTAEQKQERLTRARQSLERITPQLDAETKASLPVLREIVERVAVAPEDASDTDIRIAKDIRQLALEVSGGRAERGNLSGLKSKLAALGEVKPTISTGARRVPGGGSVGFVTIKVGDRSRTVAEIPSSAGKLSPAARAALIVRRIQTAAAKDHLWYVHAHPAVLKGQWVVAVPSAPDGYVITADPAFARLRHTTPQRLAKRLSDDVRLTLDKPALAGRDEADTEGAAGELRALGDAAYSAHDLAKAEMLYRDAIARQSDYLPAYERLIALYAEQRDKDKLNTIRDTALALPGITPDDATRLRAIH